MLPGDVLLPWVDSIVVIFKEAGFFSLDFKISTHALSRWGET